MPEPSKEQEYREEAERLAKLPRADQREIIALHRSVAKNPKVPKRSGRPALDVRPPWKGSWDLPRNLDGNNNVPLTDH